MKGEVYKEQGADSYTSGYMALPNRLVEAGILCGISTNMIHFYGLKTVYVTKTGHVPRNTLNEIHIKY